MSDNWINKIQNKGKRIYSQHGQDGVIEYVFENIGTTNKFCVEFGFNSPSVIGGTGPNIGHLVHDLGWSCLLLDSDFENTSINLHKEPLTYYNIGEVFKKYSVPTEPDYVSIDVDSIDLWLMKGMLEADYRPRLISVEYNNNYSLEDSYTITKDETPIPFKYVATMVYGASLSALNKVAVEFDYSLIAIEADAFFVRNDLLNSPPPTITEFSRFLGKIGKRHATAKQFIDYVVEYPSERKITIKDIEQSPTTFRIK